MYCGKCGQEIDEHAGYCPYCGNATGKSGEVSDSYPSSFGMSRIAGGISVIIWIMLDVAFFVTCLAHLESNMDAFDWVGDFAKIIGIILYFIIALTVFPDCIKAIKMFLERKEDHTVLMANGIATLLQAFCLQIGRWLFNDWNNNDITIVLYRIFSTYKGMIFPLVLASIAFFVLAFLAAPYHKKNSV